MRIVFTLAASLILLFLIFNGLVCLLEHQL